MSKEVYECGCGQITISTNVPESCHGCGNSIPENFTYIEDFDDL